MKFNTVSICKCNFGHYLVQMHLRCLEYTSPSVLKVGNSKEIRISHPLLTHHRRKCIQCTLFLCDDKLSL